MPSSVRSASSPVPTADLTYQRLRESLRFPTVELNPTAASRCDSWGSEKLAGTSRSLVARLVPGDATVAAGLSLPAHLAAASRATARRSRSRRATRSAQTLAHLSVAVTVQPVRIARAISFKEALHLSLRAEIRAVLVRDVSGLNAVVAPEAALVNCAPRAREAGKPPRALTVTSDRRWHSRHARDAR